MAVDPVETLSDPHRLPPEVKGDRNRSFRRPDGDGAILFRIKPGEPLLGWIRGTPDDAPQQRADNGDDTGESHGTLLSGAAE